MLRTQSLGGPPTILHQPCIGPSWWKLGPECLQRGPPSDHSAAAKHDFPSDEWCRVIGGGDVLRCGGARWHESGGPPATVPPTVAVGGSGVRLPHNLTAFRVGAAGVACHKQLHAPDPRTAVFSSALPAGCHKRVDSLQGFAGIAFRRGAVDLPTLSTLVERAPPFLRWSDDLMLSAHLELRGVPRWLVDSPIPALQPHEADKNPLHGEMQCSGGRRLPRMLTHYRLSLRWLQRRLGAWKHLDLRALSDVGKGCFPPEVLEAQLDASDVQPAQASAGFK